MLALPVWGITSYKEEAQHEKYNTKRMFIFSRWNSTAEKHDEFAIGQTHILTCALFAHECNSFQSSHFVQLLHFKEKGLYVGIDVHKDTYALCCFDFQRNELSDEMTVKATTKAVIKYLEALKKKHKEEILFVCGYEADRLWTLPWVTESRVCMRCNGTDNNG